VSRAVGRVYLPLDVEFMEDDRIAEAGEKAGWLYLAMCLRSKQLMSDGRLTERQVTRLPVAGQAARLAALVRTGLVEQTEDGWQIAAFAKHNKTAAAITEKIERRHAASAAANHKRWHIERDITDPNCDLCRSPTGVRTESVSECPETETETETVPSDEPTVSKRPHPIPEDWRPSADIIEWVVTERLNIDVHHEARQFLDYFLDKPSENRPGWDRSFKRWCREANKRAGSRPSLRAVGEYDGVTPGRRGSWDV